MQTTSTTAQSPDRDGALAEGGEGVRELTSLEALQREILVCREWSNIRMGFLTNLLIKFPRDRTQHLERKVCEMLAKWILCQQCRESVDSSSAATSPSLAPVDTASEVPSTFFPKSKTTYDDQLLRDLSLLLEIRSGDGRAKLKEFVDKYDLNKRCRAAWTKVKAEAPGVRITGLSNGAAEDNAREDERDIRGKATQLRIDYKYKGSDKHIAITVPFPTYGKLQTVFSFFNDDDGDFLPRYAVVLIRYLRTLSSGSVQLCADTDFKKRLIAEHGYRVIDLCASPINAYWDPKTADYSNFFFCSAFPDVDVYFGSVGSIFAKDLWALLADKMAGFEDADGTFVSYDSWVFTLDIPYDEDFAECLFGNYRFEDKVITPLREEFNDKNITFLAVIPHWWDLTFPSAPCVGQGPQVERMSSYIQQGHQVTCTWPSTFSNCPDVTYHAFVPKSDYAYYSCEINDTMSGVVDTEVFAVEIRARSGTALSKLSLRKVLEGRYGRNED
eukprot:PhM_4_TR57/c0_g1_i1/m.46191